MKLCRQKEHGSEPSLLDQYLAHINLSCSLHPSWDSTHLWLRILKLADPHILVQVTWWHDWFVVKSGYKLRTSDLLGQRQSKKARLNWILMNPVPTWPSTLCLFKESQKWMMHLNSLCSISYRTWHHKHSRMPKFVWGSKESGLFPLSKCLLNGRGLFMVDHRGNLQLENNETTINFKLRLQLTDAIWPLKTFSE